MTDDLLDALRDLLRVSLASWSIAEDVDVSASGDQIVVEVAKQSTLTISRAPKNMPFRWLVVANGRKRTAASVVGVLRIVRQTLAPGYQPYLLNIAPLPGRPA